MSREWELSSSSERSTALRLNPTGQARSCWVSTMSTVERDEAVASQSKPKIDRAVERLVFWLASSHHGDRNLENSGKPSADIVSARGLDCPLDRNESLLVSENPLPRLVLNLLMQLQSLAQREIIDMKITQSDEERRMW
ncbi:hypothetical protein FQN60_009410 [Etheostoma spectabile]|uniref:Uncharacterized protein n=1 Tax=Etheostoma spectabile TaxID=54343 RepID=A0A5J5DIS9_9PERO|nr:hypothetical protein FQN60_009410 [Etheostoma spectabile]